MWWRNLMFAALCLTALGGLSGLLLRGERLVDLPNLDAALAARTEYHDVVQRVNREFAAEWQRRGVEPAERADDLMIARRLALGLTGTIPSLEEIRAFEARPASVRIEWWLSRLLADRRYSDYVAERMARAFVGTDQGPFLLFRRRRFVMWLSDQLAANRPYDELVRELLTAKGLWTDAPAVNFLTATADGNEKGQPDDIKLAGRTARAFLAVRIDCLQCHDDKLGNIEIGDIGALRSGEQADFHALAAYFSQAEASLFGIRDGARDYRYQFLNEEEETQVVPQPPFLGELVPRAKTRREQLARWVTHPQNRPFARATVNRLWAILCGSPLVAPIDSIPLAGPFPPGLETLADDFVAHGYDLQRLIRVIAATDVYQRDSRRTTGEVTVEQEQAWAVFPLSRLRPDQVAGSIIQSASLTTLDAEAHILAQLGRFFQARDFVERYGDIGEDEFADHPGTITQRLLLMNGKLVRERTDQNPITNASTRIAMLAGDDQSALETAFLCTLTRRPVGEELSRFQARLADSRGAQRQRILTDICWTLLNSSEFSWNH